MPYADLLVALLVGTIVIIAVRLMVRSVQRELDIRYRRTEAWMAVYSVIRPRVPFPTIEPYMATPELLRHLIHLILERRPRLIVELGSGISTLVSGYGAELLGECRVVSVDHDARFLEVTRGLLARHGLSDRVRLVHAPLKPVEAGGHRSQWYDPDVVNAAITESGETIGLLLVDGPPGMDQLLARFPAVPLLHPRLDRRCAILVDDARRPDEQEMVRRWMAEFSGFSRQEFATEKGAVVLRREQA